VSQCVAETA
jgi:hypothetical protein